MRTISTLAAVAALAAVFAERALTCSCADLDICEKVETIPIIFLGEVVDGGLDPEEDAWSGRPTHAVLRVLERFRGVSEQTREIRVELFFAKGMCSPMPYRRGEQTLVFAARDDDGVLRDSMCTTSVFAKSRPEDLEYVRRYFAGESRTTIRGQVGMNRHGRPLEGVRVIAERNGKQYESLSDSEGDFEISGIEAGVYSIHAEHRGFKDRRERTSIQVNDRGCATQFIELLSQNRLEGFVFDAKGSPVPNISLFLYRPDQDPQKVWGEQARTDEYGHYRYRQVDPGRYHLVVSPRGPVPKSPFDIRFFPGTGNRDEAMAIEITPSSELEGVNVTLGQRYRVRDVHVTAWWPTDEPAQNIAVTCVEAGDFDDAYHRTTRSETDSAGKATCSVLADRATIVRAEAPRTDDSEALQRTQATVLPGPDTVTLRLTLTEAEHAQARRYQERLEEVRRQTEDVERQERGRIGTRPDR